MPYLMSSGYLQVHRYINKQRVKKYVHREVWENIYGLIPKGFHIHHKNGNKQDNRIENLEMVEGKYHNSFETAKRTVISLKEIKKVKLMLKKGIKIYQIAKYYGVERHTISRFIRKFVKEEN